MKKIKILFIIIFIVIVCAFILLSLISKKVSPIFFKYAEIETKKFTNIIINDAIAKTITTKAKSEEIFEVVTSSEGEIKSVDFNTININKYLTKTTKYIQECLKNIKNGNHIICK